MKRGVLLGGFLMLFVFLYGQQTIQITDFGAIPNSKENVIPIIKEVLDEVRGSCIISFPKGRYDFYPTNNQDEVTIGIELTDKKNIVIEGNGSEFIFHGKMQIALVDKCENIQLRNFSVDWDRPLTSQAEIVEATDTYLDVKIDKEEYPYLIENGKIMFTGEGWKAPVLTVFNNLFDKDKKEIVSQTWDDPLSDIFSQKAEDLGNGRVRFTGEVKMKPEVGSLIALYHYTYLIDGIRIQYSKNTTLKDLQIYHALSTGFYGVMSEDITMENASIMINEAKGRIFSSIADASHFTNCKGLIRVDNCSHTGQGDDFINVRGRNARIYEHYDNRTVRADWRAELTQAGDEMWFVDQETSQRKDVRIVKSINAVYREGEHFGFRIEFTQDLPLSAANGNFLENKTWTPSLELRNCKIQKKNRARGILVTTPKRVIIENNYFRTAGAAILIEGDIKRWFESGAHTNLMIKNNIFEDCLTSGNRDGEGGQWGEAVICITPSHQPEDVYTEPYHRNISIENNTFKVFDAPIVRARSVRGLSFVNNKIIQTNSYEPYLWQKSSFLFDGCREVTIKKNKLDHLYTTRLITFEHMKRSDIEIGKDQSFKLEER